MDLSLFPMQDIALFYGPMLIGLYLNGILYGVLVVQIYIYYQNNQDPRWIRYLVLFLLIVETANSVLDFGVVWEGLIQNFGVPPKGTPFLLCTDPIVTSIISTSVQLFQAWRLRALTKSNILFFIIVFFATCGLASGITSTVFNLEGFESRAFPDLKKALLAWLASSAWCDVLITTFFVCFLYKSKGEFAATNSVLNKIIFVTIQTGMITSIAAVAEVLTMTFVTGAAPQFIWDFSLSKLYTNSLVSMLNARVEWKAMINADVIVDMKGLDDYAAKPVSPAINPKPAIPPAPNLN